jgi:hypothetical protein
MLAAAMVTLAVGGTLVAVWRSGQPITPRGPAPADPMLASVVELNLTLAKAATPKESLDALARFSDEWRTESRGMCMVANADEMKTVAGVYTRIVRETIVARAKDLPTPDERKRVLEPIADQLRKAADETDQLKKDAPAPSQKPLSDMAQAARDANQELLRIINGL